MRLAILGYGNLGRGVENAVKQNPDTELVAIFTRRNPSDLKVNSVAKVVSVSEIENWKDKIDVVRGKCNRFTCSNPNVCKNV